MTEMSEKARQEFLSKTRYGNLTTLRRDGSPVTVPVWFEWNGEVVGQILINNGKGTTGSNLKEVSHADDTGWRP